MRKTKIALAFCLVTALLFSPLSGMDDHGANVVVTKKDGTLARGELLAVKRNALVVSVGETSTGASESIAFEDIIKVEVIKKSKVLEGMVLGGLAGGVLGVIYLEKEGASRFLFPVALVEFVADVGLGLGALVGLIASVNKTYRFVNLSKKGQDSALRQLSDYAAIKGVR